MISLETEIRKLRPRDLYTLAKILSPDHWKLFMGNIKKIGSQSVHMFTSEHIAMIEIAATKRGKLPSEIFLDEWATMGRERPTIQNAIDLLVESELFRAADFLAVDIIKGSPPNRPSKGPAAAIDITNDIIDDSKILLTDNELNIDNNIDNSTEKMTPLLPNLSILKLDSVKQISEHDNIYQPLNSLQELLSSELPLCINDRAAISSYQELSRDDDYSITNSNSLDSHSNTNDNYKTNNFSNIPIDTNMTFKRENDASVIDNIAKESVNYDELPLTVIELCRN